MNLQTGNDFFGVKKNKNKKLLETEINNNLTAQKGIAEGLKDFYNNLQNNRENTIAKELGNEYANTLSRADAALKQAQTNALMKNRTSGGSASSSAMNITTQGEGQRQETLQNIKTGLESKAISQNETKTSNMLSSLQSLQSQLQNRYKIEDNKKSGLKQISSSLVNLAKQFMTGGL